MPLDPMQIVLSVSVLVALGLVWYFGGGGRWRELVAGRFLYGVPWGTLVTVAVVVAFYVLVQGGVSRWHDPLTLPFITWSYFYPTGLLTAGIAHGSPQHLASNMAGTLAFAPIAEYAWSHYPPSSGRSRSRFGDGLLSRPWIRAIVVFPAALLVVAVLTAVLALGPGLGFSGAVFAIAGFAVVNYPITTVVAVVAASTVQTLFDAFSQPVVQATIEAGAPSPPAWAGVGFQAHLLGFLLGAVLGLLLLRRRGRRPSAGRLFVGVVLFGMAQSLWLLVGTGDDIFYLYQGAGVVLVLAVAGVTALAVAGSDRPLPRPLATLGLPRVLSRRQFAIGWLFVLTLGFLVAVAGTILAGQPIVSTVIGLALVAGLLALPAVPPVVPDRLLSSPISRRQTAVACLLVLTVLVALPSIPFNLLVISDDAVPGSGEVDIGGYAVTYEQNATTGQMPVVGPGASANETLETRHSGVIVVNEDREIWTVGTQNYTLEHDGDASVVVGGVGWHETVDVTRTGWDVLGNGTAYGVDLEVGGETTRSFASDPIRATVQIDGNEVALVPADDADEPFEVRVEGDGGGTDATAIPSVDETTTAGDLEFTVEDAGHAVELIAAADDTAVPIAERETEE
ncbi:rhomboid family intramembrane serine protease [Natronobacterium gregoryi]|uniref:Membrane protein n=2 Tax=Natronobacterium gregoryi TaxID=44930 RepID=L0ANR9_NATGS|nr:rhomboid family intramembrane serine protease [Natronobacterium gregoryi]AFZ74715.1 putative membrane protein [Natronobacterium gregoryi SP2]ELY73379.1 Rhomboid family protein [Natronobacterium gregoryi SP2]PLK20959.1 rhomboid family intramembrane serine protease [Natronobacterium gregoryi SP2]SFJ04222.1 Membrane associated serine protease, rhomboid family [Natronobacterium gregoryi]